MAQFQATVSGGRGEASRLGTAKSGIVTHAKGWNSGVEVCGYVEGETDMFDIYMTTGSSHKMGKTFIGQVYLLNGEPHFMPKN